jgi:hypothetical protein
MGKPLIRRGLESPRNETVQAANDKQQIEPMVEKLKALP